MNILFNKSTISVFENHGFKIFREIKRKRNHHWFLSILVPEEEEKDKPDVRTEILAKFGITRKPPPESKEKKSRLQRKFKIASYFMDERSFDVIFQFFRRFNFSSKLTQLMLFAQFCRFREL